MNKRVFPEYLKLVWSQELPKHRPTVPQIFEPSPIVHTLQRDFEKAWSGGFRHIIIYGHSDGTITVRFHGQKMSDDVNGFHQDFMVKNPGHSLLIALETAQEFKYEFPRQYYGVENYKCFYAVPVVTIRGFNSALQPAYTAPSSHPH